MERDAATHRAERTEREEQKDRTCEGRNAARQSIGVDCKMGHFTSFVISIISNCRGLICFEAAKRISNGFYNVFFKDKEEKITPSTIHAVSYKRVLFKHKKRASVFQRIALDATDSGGSSLPPPFLI